MSTMNDELSYEDTVKVTCWTCYRKFYVTVADFEETYAKRGNHFYCSTGCALGDLE